MIKQGDSLNLLKSIPDNSVDAIITDPPYGISFMNRDWDKFNEITDIHAGSLLKKYSADWIIYNPRTAASPFLFCFS